MNELVLFLEQEDIAAFSSKNMIALRSSGWSHWGELNSRPSHYQWDAIPLSHSGSAPAIRGPDLTTAD